MIRNLFSRPPKTDPINDLRLPIEDHVQKIDASFKLLRDTTTQVTQAAIEATKSIERRLVDTEYRFFSTIDAIEDFVIIKGGDNKWKTVNKAGQNLFGWIYDEYYDKTNQDLAHKYPIYTETLLQCAKSDEETWMNAKSSRFQECIPYGIAGYRCFDIMKTPVFDDNGKRKELITVGRDITEELEKQRRINAAFIALNSISDMVVILDFRGYIFFCNDSFLKQFGVSNYDYIVDQHICTVVDIGQDRFNEIWEVVSHNKEWDSVCTADGALDIHVTPMMNGVSYPVYYICTIRKRNHANHD